MIKPMQILEFCTSRSWGGMEMRVLQTSIDLRALGHKITVLCYPDSSLHKEAEAEGFDCFALPFGNGIHPLLIFKLKKYLSKNSFDLIHVQFSRDLRFLIPALKKSSKVPVVLTKRVGSYIKKKDILHKYLYSRVNLVLAISQVIKNNVIDTCPIDKSKVKIHYNGIKIDKYKSALIKRNEVREAMNASPNHCVISLMGRLSPGKGHEDFLNAAEIILEELSDVVFWVVGSASYGEEQYEQQIKKIAGELKNSEKIIFTGFRKDIPELIAASDIIAVPSHAEAFGNAAIEAMAAARPVVSSNTDGLIDIVVEGETGFRVPAKNPGELSKAIIELISDPELRIKFGAAGQKRVEEMFNESKQTKKLEKTFMELIEQND
ncbi:MAG: glycosyltransferase family 4 protein [Ignavibacteriae bacterium]|nr:glycosyltransferase family 1 protein [Ignavibacteriota bacterium]NOH00140.1 glycosyltransferase family 4 protein [Ignavibacteriota bacterium]